MFSKKAHSEKGSVTIEATLSLTVFLFMFIMIYSVVSLCRAQARMQVALNNTAKEISQYAYLYGLTGLDDTMKKFHDDAEDEKKKTNKFLGDVANVLDDIQSLGGETVGNTEQLNIDSIDNLVAKYQGAYESIKNTGASIKSISSEVEESMKNPKELIFGLARMAGSELMTVAVSRCIATPVTRALIQKHLKRWDDDTADAFCRSVGIAGGFDGIDFTHSTLFPKGSEEITLIAAYKVKIIQLIPINIELNITQSASTKGWLHGDKSIIEDRQLTEPTGNNGEDTVWNSYSLNKRNRIIRHALLEELQNGSFDDNTYLAVSGETYIQAYCKETNTFAFVAICNPVYGTNAMNHDAIADDLKRQVAQLRSATDNRISISVKEHDSKNNVVTRQIDCTGSDAHGKIILVVPEDEGVDTYVNGVIQELGYGEYFTVVARYGTGHKTESTGGD